MTTTEEIKSLGKKEIDYDRQITFAGQGAADTALQFWMLGYNCAASQSGYSADQIMPSLLPCGEVGCQNPHEKAYRGCDLCKFKKQ